MKRILLIIGTFFFLGSSIQAQHLWARQTQPTPGGPGGSASTRDVALDRADNVYMIGEFGGQISWGSQSLLDESVVGDDGPVYLAKFDADGNVLWANGIAGKSSNNGWGITTSADAKVFVCGEYEQTNSSTFLDFGNGVTLNGNASQSVFVAMADSSGTFHWASNILASDHAGTQYVTPKDIITMGEAIYITGEVQDSVTAGGNTYNQANSDKHKQMFLAKFDTAGNFLWFKHTNQEDGFAFSSGNHLYPGPAGNLYVVGIFSPNNSSWEGQNLGGSGTLNSQHLFIGKFNPKGNLLWHRWAVGAGTSVQEPRPIGIDQEGNVYTSVRTAGATHLGDTTFQSTTGMYLVKYDSSGVRQYTVPFYGIEGFGIAGVDVQAVYARPDGRTYVMGRYGNLAIIIGQDTLPAPPSFDGWNFAASFTPGGQVIDARVWAEEYLGQFNEFTITNIEADQQGNLYVGGIIEDGSASFEQDTIGISTGQDQTFLVKTNPNGFFISTGLAEEIFSQVNVKVYPNPAHGYCQLQYETIGFEQIDYQLLNLQGQLVKRQQLDFGTHRQAVELDLGGLSAGVYVLQLVREGQLMYRQKVVVE
jgi:hypothetical protein